MTKDETRAAAVVMKLASDGEAVQFRFRERNLSELGWADGSGMPSWDWEDMEYRIKPKPREFFLQTVNGLTTGGISHDPSLLRMDNGFSVIRVREVLE